MDWKEVLKLEIDLAPVGLEISDRGEVYFCTPKNAKIIGWAGVDGIHYCTVPELGEMVFAVSPMNVGDYVHPIARSFDDLLRLLLACGDMAALEQCYGWEEEQFNAFLIDNPVTKEQQNVLDAIAEKTGLTPMENAFAYVKALQREFDYGRIPYTQEYYDLDMNPATPAPHKEWKVYYEGSFWGRGKGRAGKEIRIDKHFVWGEESWQVPAAYACTKGLVVDFCVEIAPERVQAFMDKWQLSQLDGEPISHQMQEQMDRENPLNVEFRPLVIVNGKPLRASTGCSVCWIPQSCLPEGERRELEAEVCLAHYGLNENRAWVLHRWSFPWGMVRKSDVQSIQVKLERERTAFEGIHFCTPKAGERIPFIHPVSGVEHILTVLSVEPETIDLKARLHEEYALPTHCMVMTYRLEPELPESSFRLEDCVESDHLRWRQQEHDAHGASAFGIIGGADGPTAIFVSGKGASNGHTAISSLHFEPPKEVEWRMIFYEKMLEDTEITLLP